jgi:abelson tyrosine-protein kinase 1/abelson tyrosine-protein kinase 2
MHTPLATNDDAAMIDVLQIARSEMPEAIKTMQRTLEHVVEDGRLADESGLTLESPSSQGHSEGGGFQLSSTDSSSSGTHELFCATLPTRIHPFLH